jgi:hypothetical protein
MWPNSTDDDLRLLDGFLSTTKKKISNIPNHSFLNHDNSQSSNNINKQQNNNSSQLININDEKQLIGPLGSNL